MLSVVGLGANPSKDFLALLDTTPMDKPDSAAKVNLSADAVMYFASADDAAARSRLADKEKAEKKRLANLINRIIDFDDKKYVELKRVAAWCAKLRNVGLVREASHIERLLIAAAAQLQRTITIVRRRDAPAVGRLRDMLQIFAEYELADMLHKIAQKQLELVFEDNK